MVLVCMCVCVYANSGQLRKAKFDPQPQDTVIISMDSNTSNSKTPHIQVTVN